MHLIFDTVKDIVSIFFRTENQMRGLCVGRDRVILFSSDPAVFTTTYIFKKKWKISRHSNVLARRLSNSSGCESDGSSIRDRLRHLSSSSMRRVPKSASTSSIPESRLIIPVEHVGTPEKNNFRDSVGTRITLFLAKTNCIKCLGHFLSWKHCEIYFWSSRVAIVYSNQWKLFA